MTAVAHVSSLPLAAPRDSVCRPWTIDFLDEDCVWNWRTVLPGYGVQVATKEEVDLYQAVVKVPASSAPARTTPLSSKWKKMTTLACGAAQKVHSGPAIAWVYSTSSPCLQVAH